MPPKEPVAHGSNAKTFAMNFLVGTAATMAGASILKQLTGAFSPSPATSSTSPANQNPQSNSYPPSTYPQGYGPNQQNGNGPYQNQRRAVDHGKRGDFLGEPHASFGL
jgi:hypothetical protein